MNTGKMDIFTAIATRGSIRKFMPDPVTDEELRAVLDAGFCAPSARNIRPWHFIAIRDKAALRDLADTSLYAHFADTAGCAVIVCGDSGLHSIRELLHEDCSAAVENMLLCIHGMGLGGVWCGLVSDQSWYPKLVERFHIPPHIVPMAVIVFGHPAEGKEQPSRFEADKVHYDRW